MSRHHPLQGSVRSHEEGEREGKISQEPSELQLLTAIKVLQQYPRYITDRTSNLRKETHSKRIN